MAGRAFEKVQRSYWRSADETRYSWQTRNPVMAPREAELTRRVLARAGERLLEIGCGEGANLHHLREAGALRFGVDYSGAKTAFARRATDAHTVTADATRLPFADGAFDALLIRDVLHHIGDIDRVLAEARRVLRRGGRLTLLEPNRASPFILMQAALIPAERGVLRSTAAALASTLGRAGFRVTAQSYDQPFPIERVLLHPSFGLPSLGEQPLVARALGVADAVARRLLPRRAWMYLVFEATVP
ncbi:MAG TPA: class I SAM-dependent methyltransferase [Polyangia bacterium]|nr:class I SAM-dependent methyltransferase [Polyangia bacterium]